MYTIATTTTQAGNVPVVFSGMPIYHRLDVSILLYCPLQKEPPSDGGTLCMLKCMYPREREVPVPRSHRAGTVPATHTAPEVVASTGCFVVGPASTAKDRVRLADLRVSTLVYARKPVSTYSTVSTFTTLFVKPYVQSPRRVYNRSFGRSYYCRQSCPLFVAAVLRTVRPRLQRSTRRICKPDRITRKPTSGEEQKEKKRKKNTSQRFSLRVAACFGTKQNDPSRENPTLPTRAGAKV